MKKLAQTIVMLALVWPLTAAGQDVKNAGDADENAVQANDEVVKSDGKPDETPAKAGEEPVKLDPAGDAHLPSIWMQQKLKHSQKIFAGMVEGDMFAVEDAARNMQFVNRLENFVRGRTGPYRTQLRVFQHANNEILQGAKDNNLDRVLLGYNQLTVSCVTCHKQLRSGPGAANGR